MSVEVMSRVLSVNLAHDLDAHRTRLRCRHGELGSEMAARTDHWTSSRPRRAPAVRLGELAGRQVDADIEGVVGRPGLPPGLRLATRLVEDPVPDRDDQSGGLGSADELSWGDQSALGTVPADQGFGANGDRVADTDDGLIEDLELVVDQCVSQVGDEG